MPATVTLSTLGTELQDLLLADEIEPGSDPSYQLCKTLYVSHPLGAKIAKYPVKIAMSQQRDITVPGAPDMAVTAFRNQWKRDACNTTVLNVAVLSRVYGASALALMAGGVKLNVPIKPEDLPDLDISFSVLDPINTGGSLITTQDPTTIQFQNPREYAIKVAGQAIHPSRTMTLLNEEPIYLGYTSSAFGYVGRSVYQRALFPMKTFLQTCITDDLIVVKAGVIVAMIKQAGSIVNNVMAAVTGTKRLFIKEARTSNVISIGESDKIESLNLQNLEGPFGMARTNALHNIASAADMPAIILNSETYASGFGEGSEDAKAVAGYIDGLRETIQPVYDFLDPIIQRRAWSPAFYKTVQEQCPDWADVPFDVAFFRWSNAFNAVWPSLLTEPESEKVKVDDVRLKAVIAFLQVLDPDMDPGNKVQVLQWAEGNLNSNERLFGTPLELDWDTLAEQYQKKQDAADKAAENLANGGDDLDDDPAVPKPFAAADSASPRILRTVR